MTGKKPLFPPASWKRQRFYTECKTFIYQCVNYDTAENTASLLRFSKCFIARPRVDL